MGSLFAPRVDMAHQADRRNHPMHSLLLLSRLRTVTLQPMHASRRERRIIRTYFVVKRVRPGKRAAWPPP